MEYRLVTPSGRLAVISGHDTSSPGLSLGIRLFSGLPVLSGMNRER